MIKLIKSTLYKQKYVKRMLCKFIQKTERLSIGPQCAKFEKSFARWQERKHCIFFNSGSSANLAIVQTLLNLGQIKIGDTAGFSALTWATNPMPLIQLGLKTIPVDVELNTLNVSSRMLNQTIKKQPIKLLFLTNLLGFCDDIENIKKICEEKKIILIEDNCESLGSVYQGKKLGNFGLASTFSFFVGHHLSTIEGGAVCTDNKKVAIMLKLVRAHGWDRNLNIKEQNKLRKKYHIASTFYSKYIFYDLGFNLRPTEISGFLGNTQLRFADEIIKIRQKNFLKLAKSIYRQKIYYFPINYDHLDIISNFAFPVICKTPEIRNQLIKKCFNKLEIRPIVGGNMTQQPFFIKYNPSSYKICPNAQLINENGLYCANNPELTKQELKLIIKIFTGN